MKTRILLVDDDPAFRRATARSLCKANFEVEECDNGQGALKAFDREWPDIVVTDIVMPDMEGIELIMTLRKRMRDVRIVAISGGGRNGPTQYLSTAKMAGASAIVEKPFDPETLIERIQSLLSE